MNRILIIDDNEGICTALEILLSLHGLNTVTAHSPAAGLAALAQQEVNLVIQDMNFSADTTSGIEGEDLFRSIRNHHPAVPIILLTAWTQLEAAVNLVKQGAADYLAKPWDDDKLVTTVANLLQLNQAESELAARREDSSTQRASLSGFDLCDTVCASGAMMQVVHLAARVAQADVPVLITGPNGAGKEKIAEIIHANSGRSGPLIAVNVGAMPGELIESELFGSTAGAFTGARDREGRFASANGGTLFLDEIGNLSLSGQMKLLRVLQSGSFEKLGSNQSTTTDVKLLCATNSDLPAAIRSGAFREDLYYRINVIEIVVPPLQQRSADILPLAQQFLDPGRNLSPQCERALLDHHWPGNVRELQNCMRRAQLLSTENLIQPNDLGLVSSANTAPANYGGEHTEFAEADIRAALARHNGVVSKAARSLGLSRQAFYRRMESHGLKSQPGG